MSLNTTLYLVFISQPSGSERLTFGFRNQMGFPRLCQIASTAKTKESQESHQGILSSSLIWVWGQIAKRFQGTPSLYRWHGALQTLACIRHGGWDSLLHGSNPPGSCGSTLFLAVLDEWALCQLPYHSLLPVSPAPSAWKVWGNCEVDGTQWCPSCCIDSDL